MKNKLHFRMYIILVISVLAVAASVYGAFYTLSHNAMLRDIRERADGVKEYIQDTLTVQDFEDIGRDNEAGALARLRIQENLDRLRRIGNIKRLYLAREDVSGQIITTISILHPDGDKAAYIPEGEQEADLRRSFREVVAIQGDRIYHTEHGSIYTIYWPVMNQKYESLGVVCMEFDADSIYESYKQTAMYSLALSGALILLFSIIAYLSMSMATEPFYKKLAYTDFLTGYENRMAFEQKLRECGPIADRGKSVTLIIFDLNNLKTVNDTLGHKQGDVYLQNTADAISRILAGKGDLYRIGGDEFASVVVGGTEKELQGIMDAMREEKRPVLKDHPFSCAYGAATFKKGVDRSLRDVFKRADEAMYEEKKRQKSVNNEC